MRKLLAIFLLLCFVAPAIAEEHKCDCHAHEMSDACKKECGHAGH